MQIATKPHTIGDRRRWQIDYSAYLQDGAILSAGTVTTPSTTSSIDTVSISDDAKSLFFFVNGGALNEVFTAVVQVTTNKSEIVNDTIPFTVVAI